MKIKKFTGKSIVEALNKVKKEFGDNAVILNSEKIKTDNGSFYEITAAIDEEEVIFEPKSVIGEKKEKDKIDLKFKPEREFGEEKGTDLEFLKKEILEIKNILNQAFSEKITEVRYLELLEKGVPPFIAKELVLKKMSVWEFVKKRLEEKGVVPNSRCQLFLGEAGVGKTTAVFKLAAWYRYTRNSRVMVISLDNYKVGGNYQAERMAEFLEIDFEAMDIDTFREILPALKAYDYILIDTPGLGNKFWIDDLEVLSKEFTNLRFFWVVKAIEHYISALQCWKFLESLPVEGIFLTFTDRILTGYSLLWLLDSRFPPINFISTGERVPEDIERADTEHLKRLFLKGIKED